MAMPMVRRRSVKLSWVGNQTTCAALWMLAGAGFYALVLIFAKAAGERLHPTQILLFRSVVMLACVALAIAMHFPRSLKTEHLGLHGPRISASFFSMLFAFVAVIHLPLADATKLSFSKSSFTTLLASLILGEVVGARRLVAVLVGFAGVVVVLRPEGGDSINVYGLLAIFAAASSGLATFSCAGFRAPTVR